MAENQIRAGWLEGASVRHVLESHGPLIAQLPFVLINSLDSDCAVMNMPWAESRMRQDPQWALSTSPLIVAGSSVAELLDDRNLFTGFDEVWIPTKNSVTAPPDSAYLVAPRRLDTEPIPDEISSWLRLSGCRLGLGDGDGLNYAIADLELGESLGFG